MKLFRKLKGPQNRDSGDQSQRDHIERGSSESTTSLAAAGTVKTHLPWKRLHPYRALNVKRKEFRTLHVYPGQEDDPVKCKLVTESLGYGQTPDYETISYCWGDEKTESDIELDGKRFSAPASGVAAIRRMRQKDRDRILWVDAICINQGDLDERAQQVQLMEHIYSNAMTNLIYLGQEDSVTMSKSIVRSINVLLDEIRSETDDFWYFGSTVLNQETLQPAFPKKDFHYPQEIDFDALDLFYNRPYFRRLWVTQETILAKVNQAFYGQHEFRFLDLLRVKEWIQYKTWYKKTTDPGLHNWWLALDQDQSPLHDQILSSIDGMLMYGQTRQCTDPRDRIYGLLGVLRCPIPDSLQPDYRRPLVDLMASVVKVVLVSKEGMFSGQVFAQLEHKTRDDVTSSTWPSWLPKFDGKRGTYNWSTKFDACNSRSQNFAPGSQYHAMLHRNLYKIVLRGFIVDVVVSTVPALRPAETINNTQKGPKRAAEELKHIRTSRNICIGESKQDENHQVLDQQDLTLVETLIAENTSLGKPFRMDSLGDYRHYASFLESGTFPSSQNGTDGGPHDKAVMATNFQMAYYQACENRSVFRMGEGKVGVGPAVLQPGDHVAVVYGSNMPLALRPCAGADSLTYRLLGQCYVRGIMHGEAMKRFMSDGDLAEMFKII